MRNCTGILRTVRLRVHSSPGSPPASPRSALRCSVPSRSATFTSSGAPSLPHDASNPLSAILGWACQVAGPVFLAFPTPLPPHQRDCSTLSQKTRPTIAGTCGTCLRASTIAPTIRCFFVPPHDAPTHQLPIFRPSRLKRSIFSEYSMYAHLFSRRAIDAIRHLRRKCSSSAEIPSNQPRWNPKRAADHRTRQTTNRRAPSNAPNTKKREGHPPGWPSLPIGVSRCGHSARFTLPSCASS
ncbi:hypothetical protein D2E22_0826 [Bifidobacterium castoris]|uniref:Uncharacterized protein n=1 Tax=Bifidobacterium castoris TaxID=2306972 RepID=A0A430F995_9BIFI|nr:hypothetical protein D2E22_0826 [Bifidobacterium castoris]